MKNLRSYPLPFEVIILREDLLGDCLLAKFDQPDS